MLNAFIALLRLWQGHKPTIIAYTIEVLRWLRPVVLVCILCSIGYITVTRYGGQDLDQIVTVELVCLYCGYTLKGLLP